MRAPLHALVVGSADGLAVGDGVRARSWTSVDVALEGRDLPKPALGVLAHRAAPDTTPLLDTDLLVFRGPFATAAVCTDCDAADLDEDVLLAHAAATGHAWRRPHEAMVRGLVESILADIGRLRGRGIVVELDVDPWAEGCTWPADLRATLELDLLAMLLRVADVVVAGSPDAGATALRAGARDVMLIDPASPTAAAERIAAWRRAAEHAGTGLLAALEADPAMIAEAAATAERRLDHRLAIRAVDDLAAVELADLRASTGVCWGVAAANRPLVTVVVPVLDEGAHLAERAVRSALAADTIPVDVLVVGDAASGAREAVAAVGDPRARWVHVALPAGATNWALDESAGSVEARGIVLAGGLDAASGSWHLVLRPDAILTPAAIPALLDAAIANGLEVAYGRVMLLRGGELAGMAGGWPPTPATIPTEAALVSAALGAVPVDPKAWIDGEDATASLWRRYLALGARVGALDDVVAVRELGAGIPAGSAA
jgi:hypothetical protein